jgi:PAS domain S-box-containing protein
MDTHSAATVLVVGDDSGVRGQRERLERAGYRVVTARSADDARFALRRGGIDLLLLGHRLSGGRTGLELHEQLHGEGVRLPVILAGAFDDEAVIIRALRAGVRDVVSQSPQSLDYLAEAAGRVLAQARLERRLAESETRLAGIFASAHDAILVARPDQRITLFNAAAERMFRCPAAAALGKRLSDFIPKELRPPPGTTDESVTLLLEFGRVGRRANGEEFPIEATVARVDTAEGKLYTVMVRDVTERHRAEEALRRSEERFREQAALLDKATDAIMVKDQGGRVRYWNRGAERLYGHGAAAAIGRAVADLLYRDPAAEPAEPARAVLERGEWFGELQQVTADGKDVVVESRWTLVRDKDGRPGDVLVINTDVTEKKKLEARYLHAQRMEGIGTLAGGVAHDFNNLLTIITGYSELALTQLAPDDASRELLAEVCKAGERAAGLTRQLLAFSRRMILSLRVLDLNALVREMEKLLRRLIGEDVDLATALESDLGPVRADPVQLEQVILNLVVNARDAMPTGGHLTIETQNVDLDTSAGAYLPELRPGRYVLLAVTDTGVGMDEPTQARIFEPFFTTKPVGQGTGLGLATVYGIVKQLGGHVEVYSEPGRGTTFKIYLPRVSPEGGPRSLPEVTAVPRGSETVLLVEDEAGVRSLARLALQSNGYAVLEAADADAAVGLCQAHAGPIDLLVTDVVMPRVSGRQLADRVAALRPGVKVLFLSGYTDDAIVRHGVLETAKAFLQKPFTPTTLARKVREVLDQ